MSETEETRTYALRFTERAQRDIDAATVHFAETSSPEVAIAWREGLYEALAFLTVSPSVVARMRLSVSGAKCVSFYIVVLEAR